MVGLITVEGTGLLGAGVFVLVVSDDTLLRPPAAKQVPSEKTPDPFSCSQCRFSFHSAEQSKNNPDPFS